MKFDCENDCKGYCMYKKEKTWLPPFSPLEHCFPIISLQGCEKVEILRLQSF